MSARQLRTPPQAVEAERNVLGALMLVNEALPRVADWLRADDFYRQDHAAIYAAMLDFAGKGEAFDSVTLGEHFEGDDGSVEPAYLVELVQATASAANVEAYAEIVREKAQLRRLIGAGTDLVNGAFQPSGRQSGELAMEASSILLAMSDGGRRSGPKAAREVVARWFDDLTRRHESGDGMVGMLTPWTGLNRATLGLCAGDLIVAAGRPSMGKSALAVNLATSAALRGQRVLFFNLEMTDVSILNRCIASVMEIPLRWLRAGGQGAGDESDYWPRATEGVRRLRDAPLLIDDTSNLTTHQIVARAKREHLRAPLGLVIVDHLHLVKLGKGETHRELGDATAALKGLAKALGCPVVLLSQLNRGLEGRPNKRPQMQDLRESGAIEQDADLILFLYRDDYYAEREGRESDYPGWVELSIAKQREGEAGHTVWLRDRLAFGLLEDHDGPAPVRQAAQAQPMRMMTRSRGREAAAGAAE